jgi:hypothetical protein
MMTGMKSSLVRSLLFLGVATFATIATAQSSGSTFTATGDLTTPRVGHTATLLTNGRVLIAGGAVGGGGQTLLASAELYDPSTRTFTATGDMTRERASHTAILLPDGKVLIAGSRDMEASAEIYDPSKGTFTAVFAKTQKFHIVTAVLLPNGKLLIAGFTGLLNGLASAELYDPSTGTFTSAGELSTRGFVTVCMLDNGKVLISGDRWGDGVGDELYDPETGTVSVTGIRKTTTGPFMYNSPVSALLLKNGKVLITLWSQDSLGDPVGSGAEIYDPSTGTFTDAFWNPVGSYYPASGTLLPDGAVLLTARNYAVLYDSDTGTLSGAGPMLTGQAIGRPQTLLPEGNVLISGGWICCGNPGTTIASAEIYHPAVSIPAPVLLSLSGDGQGQGAIQHAGTSRIASATDPAVAGEYLTIYGTGLLDGSVHPPQVAIGGRLAEVLFFGNAPGFPGLNQVNVRMPSGVAPGPAVPVRLNYIGRPSNEVTIGVR